MTSSRIGKSARTSSARVAVEAATAPILVDEAAAEEEENAEEDGEEEEALGPEPRRAARAGAELAARLLVVVVVAVTRAVGAAACTADAIAYDIVAVVVPCVASRRRRSLSLGGVRGRT